MSITRQFAVYFRNVLIDIGPDKAQLQREYPGTKYLILPYCTR